MPRKPTAYYRPSDLDEVLRFLHQPNTVPLAGGTNLLATEEGLDSAVVDLQDAGLDQLTWADDGRLLRIGAMVKLADLEAFLDPLAGQSGAAALLQRAIHRAGPNTYRNAATIGGVIASRLADSELLAALLVLDATINMRLPAPETLTLAAYLREDERPPGLIIEIQIYWTIGIGASERVARTPADSPIVSVTAWRPADGALRLAATGVGPRPGHLSQAETALTARLDDSTIDTAATAAQDAADHPGDFRGDATYRAKMAGVLTRRVLSAIEQTPNGPSQR